MRMFITSKNKYLSNDMTIFGTCSIPLNFRILVRGHWCNQIVNFQKNIVQITSLSKYNAVMLQVLNHLNY